MDFDIKLTYELTEEEQRISDLIRKEEEGTITEEEQSDLDYYLKEAEYEMYEDLKYMR